MIEKYQNPENYPGAILLDEIAKLTEEERDKIDYCGICHIISQEMAVRAIREAITINDLPLMENID